MFTGLCASCRHHRWIVSGRGSRFLFCEWSKSDPAWPKYPPLPVMECSAYVRAAGSVGAADPLGESDGDRS
ncbi:MAG TPA: hypothetical protein VF720_05665 [Candidatus Eisenbacteria bacterium]